MTVRESLAKDRAQQKGQPLRAFARVVKALRDYVEYWDNLQDIDEDDQRLLRNGRAALDTLDRMIGVTPQ